MDIFAQLPPELRLMVLKHAPNLASLHSLVQASPHAACTFDGFSAEIIESVMTSSMAHENQTILTPQPRSERTRCAVGHWTTFSSRTFEATTLPSDHLLPSPWRHPSDGDCWKRLIRSDD